jgi:UDP-N-acetylmuramate dehydrogenase
MNELKPEHIEQQVELAPLTTMKVGGRADYLVRVRTRDEVRQACDWAAEQGLPIFVLGEGSNVVVSEAPLHRLVIKMEITGFAKQREDARSMTIAVGAGEHWDSVVERAVELGLSGIEAMSMIPGTTGAAPVQNAGAYGQEMADTLVEVEAYDMTEREFVVIPRDECGFGYRTSFFKTAWAGRYVITGVTMRLHKGEPAEPTYESLKRYLAEHDIARPTLRQIREGVTAVRARILPDPSVVPNTGSFFKNPIVDEAVVRALEAKFEKVPSYKYGDKYKLAAGWILEQCGFKGAEYFGLKMWAGHALVITNPNGAGYDDLVKLVELIVRTVQEKFGITLEPEPLFVR